MSGAAGAFLLPSSRSQRPVSDQLKHMVPKLESRAQTGFRVAASMHEERFQHTKSCRPAGKLADVDFTEQDAHSRPHVAIALPLTGRRVTPTSSPLTIIKPPAVV